MISRLQLWMPGSTQRYRSECWGDLFGKLPNISKYCYVVKDILKKKKGLLIILTLGKIYERYCLTLILTLPSWKCLHCLFCSPVSHGVFLLHSQIWHNIWNVKFSVKTYKYIYTNIYTDINLYRERKGEQERTCVTKAEIISFSGLYNGTYRKILHWALSKYHLSLINTLTVCFLWTRQNQRKFKQLL